MFKFSLDSLSTHIAAENESSLEIYNDLVAAYNKSLRTYPKDINIIGVYFIDILKLLSHTYFKAKEISLEIAPHYKYITRKLDTWPYIGYEDIKNGCDIESKKFGKGSSIKQSKLRLFLQDIVNAQYLLGRGFSKRLSLVSPKIDSGSNLLWLKAADFKTSLINLQSGWFSVPQLGDQLGLLNNLVSDIMENHHHPISPKLITSLLENHIKADCSEGDLNLKFEGDILLLRSGVELQNRMLSIAAIQQELPVINIMHGEAYGVYDEPIFSDFGEHMYSSGILGYGDGALAAQDTYTFGLKSHVKYIKSNGVNSLCYYRP
ncbi:uncharacterized protein METZ01_LOCUS345529, partial [marine metagenome]